MRVNDDSTKHELFHFYNQAKGDEGCGDDEAAKRLKSIVEKGMANHKKHGEKPSKKRKGEDAERAAWDLRDGCQMAIASF